MMILDIDGNDFDPQDLLTKRLEINFNFARANHGSGYPWVLTKLIAT